MNKYFLDNIPLDTRVDCEISFSQKGGGKVDLAARLGDITPKNDSF
jgi:hypothetical protein